MKVEKPILVISGGNHYQSVQSLCCGIWARAAENMLVAGRFGVGVLIYWDLFPCYLV